MCVQVYKYVCARGGRKVDWRGENRKDGRERMNGERRAAFDKCTLSPAATQSKMQRVSGDTVNNFNSQLQPRRS